MDLLNRGSLLVLLPDSLKQMGIIGGRVALFLLLTASIPLRLCEASVFCL